MSRRIEWAKRAHKKLSRLDRPTQKRILSAIDLLLEEGRGDVRRFEGGADEDYRLRVGDWVGSRGDIYKR